MLVSQLLKALAAYWVSHVSHAHGKVSVKQERYNSNVFVQAIITFCLVHFAEGILSAYLSKENSDRFSDKAIKSLARSKMSFFQEHDLIAVVFKANKDF